MSSIGCIKTNATTVFIATDCLQTSGTKFSSKFISGIVPKIYHYPHLECVAVVTGNGFGHLFREYLNDNRFITCFDQVLFLAEHPEEFPKFVKECFKSKDLEDGEIGHLYLFGRTKRDKDKITEKTFFYTRDGLKLPDEHESFLRANMGAEIYDNHYAAAPCYIPLPAKHLRDELIQFHGLPALDFDSARDLTLRYVDELSLNIPLGAEKLLIDYMKIGHQNAINSNREEPIIGGKVVMTVLSIESERLITYEYVAHNFDDLPANAEEAAKYHEAVGFNY